MLMPVVATARIPSVRKVIVSALREVCLAPRNANALAAEILKDVVDYLVIQLADRQWLLQLGLSR